MLPLRCSGVSWPKNSRYVPDADARKVTDWVSWPSFPSSRCVPRVASEREGVTSITGVASTPLLLKFALLVRMK